MSFHESDLNGQAGDIPDPSEDIPRKFNETLTDWAIRCQILRRTTGVKEIHEKPIR